MKYLARKIVFLDIDGVVNTLQITEDLQPKYYTEYDKKVGNEQAVRWLNKLCLESGAHIVISSSWRHAGLETCGNCLYNSGLDKKIKIIDKTPTHFNKDRGYEIKCWLKEHPEVYQFVILDDDSDMGSLADHLVKCDGTKGFLAEEYYRASEILDDFTSYLKALNNEFGKD